MVLGLDNAGKTTIIKKLSKENIQNICPTQGFNLKQLTHGNIKLTMWDVGGQKAIRTHWKSYYESNDGLIYVIDAADKPRLEESRDELANLLQEDALAGVPLLIFANKQDLLHAVSPEDVCLFQLIELHIRSSHQWD